MKQRLNYDEIAHLYDNQPFRQKSADTNLKRFVENSGVEISSLSALDLGCGTGNQLIANKELYPNIAMTGLDLFEGMLSHARKKSSSISWVQGDSGDLPFLGQEFDYISCQYSFHHVQNKQGLLSEAFRVLRPSGVFVMENICPREMKQSLLYRFFPKAYEDDLRDFWDKDRIIDELWEVGFENIQMSLSFPSLHASLKDFYLYCQQRDNNSQLYTLEESLYKEGMELIRRELARQELPEKAVRTSLCLLTIKGRKPKKG